MFWVGVSWVTEGPSPQPSPRGSSCVGQAGPRVSQRERERKRADWWNGELSDGGLLSLGIHCFEQPDEDLVGYCMASPGQEDSALLALGEGVVDCPVEDGADLLVGGGRLVSSMPSMSRRPEVSVSMTFSRSLTRSAPAMAGEGRPSTPLDIASAPRSRSM